MKSHPTFQFEQELWSQGKQFIAGVDEVGRGAFAGPAVVAAVILPQKFPHQDEINDSKLLSAKKREQLALIIQKHAIAYAIVECSLEVINQIGVGKACQKGFFEAINKLSIVPDHMLIDAFYINEIEKEKQTPLIHGDRLSISIAAASIIAKVYRDNLMRKLSIEYPEFCFAENKGYGTLEHRIAIKKHGLCPIHRTSFDLQKFLA